VALSSNRNPDFYKTRWRRRKREEDGTKEETGDKTNSDSLIQSKRLKQYSLCSEVEDLLYCWKEITAGED
jgi:hypothetical protein